jgi:hypothetical protein
MLRAWFAGPTTKVGLERRACRISAGSTTPIRRRTAPTASHPRRGRDRNDDHKTGQT